MDPHALTSGDTIRNRYGDAYTVLEVAHERDVAGRPVARFHARSQRSAALTWGGVVNASWPADRHTPAVRS